jgi:hypothetical protein
MGGGKWRRDIAEPEDGRLLLLAFYLGWGIPHGKNKFSIKDSKPP